MTNETFGTRLLQVLRNKALSQAQAAKLLSTTPGFLSDVVNDVKKPGLEFLVRAQEVLGVSIDWLVSGLGIPARAPFDLDVHRLVVGIVEVVRSAVVEEDQAALTDLEELLSVPTTDELATAARLELIIRWSNASDAPMVAAAIHNSVPATLNLDERLRRALTSAISMWQLKKHDGHQRHYVGQFGARPDSDAPRRQEFRNVQLITGRSVKAAGGNFIDQSTTYEGDSHAGADPTHRRR